MTDTPKRVQRQRTKGSKLPPNTVCVTRGCKLGNPFTAEGAIEAGYSKEAASRMAVYGWRQWRLGNPLYQIKGMAPPTDE